MSFKPVLRLWDEEAEVRLDRVDGSFEAEVLVRPVRLERVDGSLAEELQRLDLVEGSLAQEDRLERVDFRLEQEASSVAVTVES